MHISSNFDSGNIKIIGRTGNKADLAIGANYIAEKFGCLSITLEQPFNDADADVQPHERCKNLGGANLQALNSCLDSL